jgi:hypothetical protein
LFRTKQKENITNVNKPTTRKLYENLDKRAESHNHTNSNNKNRSETAFQENNINIEADDTRSESETLENDEEYDIETISDNKKNILDNSQDQTNYINEGPITQGDRLNAIKASRIKSHSNHVVHTENKNVPIATSIVNFSLDQQAQQAINSANALLEATNNQTRYQTRRATFLANQSALNQNSTSNSSTPTATSSTSNNVLHSTTSTPARLYASKSINKNKTNLTNSLTSSISTTTGLATISIGANLLTNNLSYAPSSSTTPNSALLHQTNSPNTVRRSTRTQNNASSLSNSSATNTGTSQKRYLKNKIIKT